MLAAVVAVAACAAQPPRYAMRLPERHATLANGMRIILLPDPTTDLVEVDVRYEVGGNEDPPGKSGLAHLVEHLMFEQHQAGPDRPPLGAALREHSLGYNAYTVWDSTHFQTLARSDELETLLALEASRLATGCATIDEQTFAREREVVRNEIRQRHGTPDALLLNEVLAAAYPPGHPYRRMIGGDDEQIAAITLADVCKFMADYYVPERATVIIAGDAHESVVAHAMDRWLAAVPARTPAPRADVTIPVLERRTVTYEADVEEASLIAIWALPPRFSADDAAVGFIVGSITSDTSWFGAVYDFATEVRPIVLGGSRAPIFAVQVALRDPDRADEALEAIWKSARAAHRGIEEGEGFRELRTRSLGNLALRFEPLGERTNAFADYAQFDRDGKYFAGEIERIQKTDGDHVRAVVERVLDPDKAVVIVVKPKKGAGLYRRAQVGSGAAASEQARDDFPIDRAEAASPIPVPAETLLDKARHFQLDNGMRVVLLAADSPMPVMTASLVFAVGAAHDPPDKVGLARMAAEHLNPPSADQRGVGTIFDGFAQFGIDRDGHADSDFTEFTVQGLSVYQDIMLSGLERMIKGASYDQDGLEGEARRYEAALRKQTARAQQAAQTRLVEAVFGAGHPYTVTAVPTPETIGRIGYDAARGFAAAHYSAANATLVVAGKFDAERAERAIRDQFGAWARGRADAPVTAPGPERTGPIYIGVVGPDNPLVQVRIAYPAPSGRDPAYAARLVLAEMLTRRVAAVRERLGASYGVYARYVPRVGPGLYLITGAIDAERAGAALAEIRASLDGLRHADGFLDDFVRARRQVLLHLVAHASDSASLADELVEMAELNLPPDAAGKLRREVGALSPRDVIQLVNTELRPAREIVVGVGARAALEEMFTGAGLRGVRYEETAQK
jgi:zinc protease